MMRSRMVLRNVWCACADKDCCRPTEIEVDADGGKRKIRAVAFISPPEMLINEGLPPPDR